LLNPDKTPPSDMHLGFAEKLYASRLLIPTVLLIAAVIGSIYAGIATPTEAAVLGVAGSLILSFASGSLNWETFYGSVMGAMRTSCMIAFILTGAAFLTTAMGFTGIPRAMAAWITGQALSPVMLIAMLTLLFMVMGCFLDGISMVVLTAAVILPTVEAAKIDLLWFGVFIVMVVEMAQITPPVGFNLYVLQGMTGKDIFSVGKAALPFFCLMVIAVVLIWIFPEIVTYLPRQMLGTR
jgi:tripartite ATP-independent transporter DctM subunit